MHPVQYGSLNTTGKLLLAQGTAIIVGIGRFGQIVTRILRARGYLTVVFDVNVEMIDTMTALGVKAFYGDGARPDLLDAAGLASTHLLVVALDDRECILSIVVRETFDSAVRAGRYSLEALGTPSDDAEQLIKAFVDADRQSMRSLAELHDPDIPPNKNAAYMAMLKELRSQETRKLDEVA
ncbi:NAD-binding protein [Telluria mixta]|uniref:NAD-binding protein n=1 Tax=Telluria mixta TaxID=34071 RepID=A0ABT2C4E6_9BURK|nr:NAD-binding protein [Telluria mixta]MCS0632245.1 NAD-binding protein [Telluria mixta]WEM94997.1 NAD-binding protein [Telluria mixta]